MHINSSISNLIGGVSQQPELLRLPSHLKTQENGYSTPSNGLSKRPGSVHLGNIPTFTGEGFHTTIDYGPRGVFHLNVLGTSGAIKMATESGSAVPIYNAAGAVITSAPYLVTSTPEESLRVVKEADTSFLINTTKVVTETITAAATSIWMGLIWVKVGNYGRDYSVTLPGVTFAGSAVTTANAIAATLSAQMTAAGIPGVSCVGATISFTGAAYAGPGATLTLPSTPQYTTAQVETIANAIVAGLTAAGVPSVAGVTTGLPAVYGTPPQITTGTGAYGPGSYTVTVPALTAITYSTPDGSVAAHLALTKTDVIAASLAAQMTAAGVPGVSQSGSIITLTAGGYEGMLTEDGSGGSSMTAVHRSVRNLADLPSRRVANGFTVKVEGGDATGAGDHYLTYNAADGVYKEARAPTESWGKPTPSTMPISLVPYLDGFKLSEIDWPGRTVGDSLTNPPPSFVGQTINDLYFFQDRMGLISGEGFDISEVGEYYNFQRTTVLDLLDSDPVSGTVSHPKVSTLRHAIPFNKRLLLFSDKAQFELASGDFLTPKTVATRQLSEFECSSVVRPVGMGTSLYFPVDKGEHSACYNFFVNGADSLEDAVDISGHIPEYVPRNVTQIAASPVNNLFVAYSKEDPTSLYVYQFYQDGPQRLQSAWHKWPLVTSGEILSVSIVDTRLLLLVKRLVSGSYVVTSEVIPLTAAPTGYRLDRMTTILPGAITVTGSSLLATSAFTLPFAASEGQYYAVVTNGTEAIKTGSVYKITTTLGGTTAAIAAGLTGCTLLVGQGYAFRGTLGRFMVREQAGGGSAGVSRGRTQIGRMWVNFAQSATFSVEVAVEGRPVATYKETGRLLGTSSARIGLPSVGDGRFSCPVLAQNTKVTVTLVNDTPLPSSFLSVDWEGYHVDRGNHV